MYVHCMYVCMYVHCMYVCMYVCMYIVCMYVHCMYVCMYVCIYVCMYVHTFTNLSFPLTKTDGILFSEQGVNLCTRVG